ncbi:MAG TPA: FCSD flavin-binding domain-containing protein, partial [Bradyrhizobium sp.]|nr:FCSD flavin-binding domain-containing protein [Bradyrhizobium sp.]
DIFAEVEGSGFTSPIEAPREVRQREAASAQAWYKAITVETFG